jgi:uncharacterized protein YneF (UPF0154 family)
MTEVIVAVVSLIVGAVGGWFAYSKWGAKAMQIETDIKQLKS